MSNPTEDVLEHYGKKGMKWGIRKEAELNRNMRVATGGGSRRDKFSVWATASGIERLQARKALGKGSIQNVATMRMARLQAQKTRIENGQATVRDRFERVMLTPVVDLIKGR